MAVTLSGEVVDQYERFSLYNSPYPAHDRGCAVDLYPGSEIAASPVAGEVIETLTVDCPPKPYAVDEDHLILIDRGPDVARVLHVDPAVEPGERVAVGDPLGRLVRSGFFGRWVDNHVHLEFRRHGRNLRRASGSLPLSVGVDVTPIEWDGTGEVVGVGPTHVRLDAPDAATSGFVAMASDGGTPLDGGLVHYSGGGSLTPTDGALSLLGTPVGTADGRDVVWNDVALRANGVRATGLSLFASRIPFGPKIVFHDGHGFAVGDRLEVSIEPTTDPVKLG